MIFGFDAFWEFSITGVALFKWRFAVLFSYLLGFSNKYPTSYTVFIKY